MHRERLVYLIRNASAAYRSMDDPAMSESEFVADFLLNNGIAPVVRCKDCVLRKTEDCMMYYECDCGEQHTWESDNDFCSHGERRVEECYLHGKCVVEDAFNTARMPDSKMFCAIGRSENDLAIRYTADRCVCCGDVIPEGRQVCPACERGKG